MYNDKDLASAVDVGVIDASTAEALGQFLNRAPVGREPDEENFRLASGFNDIFVTVAALIMLFAMWWIGNNVQSDSYGYSGSRYKFVGALLTAATAWLLAEYFVRVRRMALPSVVLLLAFICGIFVGVTFYLTDVDYTRFGKVEYYLIADLPAAGATYFAQMIRDNANYAIAAFISAIGAFFFWWRMRAPIAIAATTGMAAVAMLSGIFYFAKVTEFYGPLPFALTLCAGIAIFAYAMWWDMSDTARKTQRSDIAFWLHLIAAPMIAHPLFGLIGFRNADGMSTLAIICVLALYAFFAAVAIATDRRALLVSALAYVLIAMTALFRQFGLIELGVAVTALIIGSALLLLSAFWAPIRRILLIKIPLVISSRLPATY